MRGEVRKKTPKKERKRWIIPHFVILAEHNVCVYGYEFLDSIDKHFSIQSGRDYLIINYILLIF